MKAKIIATFLISVLYAVLRYNIFGDVNLSQIPLYVLNKSISLATVIFLFYASFNYSKNNFDLLKKWNLVAYNFFIVHVLISLSILTEKYYPKFFTGGKMNLKGELIMLFGILAAVLFWYIKTNAQKIKNLDVIKSLMFALIILHVLFMGIPGWAAVDKWHGYLPPISLLSFIFSLYSFFVYVKKARVKIPF